MIETEWLNCTDPQPMLDFLKGKASDRKLRLFLFACVRRMWDRIPDDRLKRAIEVSERHTDGLVDNAALGIVVKDAHRARRKRSGFDQAVYEAARYHPGSVFGNTATIYLPGAAASFAVPDVPPFAMGVVEGDKFVTKDLPMTPAHMAWLAVRDAEYDAQAQLLHEIFGNPFHPVAADPTWLTPNVISLAQTIYDERAFKRMPELATELEQAGCTNADILAHCRQSGDHVRGCWVIHLFSRNY